MKLEFLFKTKGLSRMNIFLQWIPGRPLRAAQQQGAKPEWKSWASPCLCPRVFDCWVMHSEISVEKLFGGSLGVRVWAFADWRDCQTPADCEMEYVVCVYVCVFLSVSLFLYLHQGRSLLYWTLTPSLLRDGLTAKTCHCVRQTQWQPFCKTLLRLFSSILLTLPGPCSSDVNKMK